MKQYATVAWNSPLLGSRFSGIVFDGLVVYAKWTIPTCKNSSYGRSIRLVGVAHPMRQGSNGRIRLLPTWRLIFPGAFTVTPWWWPPAWQLSVVHGGGYGTTSPASTDVVTNQASAHIQMSRASLDKCRPDPIHITSICMYSNSPKKALTIHRYRVYLAVSWQCIVVHEPTITHLLYGDSHKRQYTMTHIAQLQNFTSCGGMTGLSCSWYYNHKPATHNYYYYDNNINMTETTTKLTFEVFEVLSMWQQVVPITNITTTTTTANTITQYYYNSYKQIHIYHTSITKISAIWSYYIKI